MLQSLHRRVPRFPMALLAVAVMVVGLPSPPAGAAVSWKKPTFEFSPIPSSGNVLTTTVKWTPYTPPTGTVTGYQVVATWLLPDKTTKSKACNPTSLQPANLSCAIDLDDGTNVNVVVKATISNGTPTSATSDMAKLSVAPPDSPRITLVRQNPGALYLEWDFTDPTPSAGPDTVYNAPNATSFAVNYKASDSTQWSLASCTGLQKTCTISGLTNLKQYDLRVIARNAVNANFPSKGNWSVENASATPFKLSAPTNVTLTNGGASSIVVSWNAAKGFPTTGSSNGLLKYIAYAKAGTDPEVPCAETQLLTCTITGLTPGRAYAVRVSARYSITSGLLQADQTETTVTPLPTITIFNPVSGISPTVVVGSTPGSQKLKISWTPGSANGSSIVSYVVRIRDVTASGNQEQLCSIPSPTVNTKLECSASGLTNGHSYELQIVADNGLVAIVTVTAVPYGPSNSPRNVSVAGGAGSGKLTVRWNSPDSNGGAAILKYVATAVDRNGADAGTCVATAPATSCDVTNLINGSNYSARVVAINGPTESAGFTSSATSSLSSAKVYGPPSSVQNLKVDVGVAGGGSESIQVTWDGSTDSNGMDITGYRVTVTNLTRTVADKTCSVALNVEFKCFIGGLINGDTYRVAVVALNGQESVASWLDVVPYGAPGAINGATLQGGFSNDASGKLKITWLPAMTNGKAVEYTVTVLDISGQIASTCSPKDPPNPTLTCTAGGLINGNRYTARIDATNGPGSFSTVTLETLTKVFGPPSSSQKVEIAAGPTVGSGTISLKWTAPAEMNGGELQQYKVEVSIDQYFSSIAARCTSTVAARACTISSLTNGIEYFVRVLAFTGDYTYSTATAKAKPFFRPDVVSGIEATVGSAEGVGSNKIRVNWSKPISNGMEITSYLVTASLNGSVKSQCSPSSLATLNCTLQGLTNGKAYTIKVYATNAIDSTSVEPDGVVATPYDKPELIRSPQVLNGTQAGSQKLLVSWTAPLDGNGRDVDRYVAQAKLGSVVAGSCSVAPTSTSCFISGLTNGSNYTVAVLAYNNYNSDPGSVSIWVSSVTFNPYTKPSIPTNVAASVGNAAGGSGKVKVTWSAPTSNGGNAIQKYIAVASPGGLTCVEDTAPLDNSCRIDGLQNGTSYTISVTALNGDSSVSDPGVSSLSYSPYGPPSTVRSIAWSCVLSSGTKSICVSGELIATWSAPQATNGRPITEYKITLTDTTGTPSVQTFTTSPSILLYDFRGLTNGHQYKLEVQAVNGNLSVSPTASPATTANPFTVPQPPSITSITVPAGEPGSLVVTWSRRSGDDGGSAISSFRAQAKIGNAVSGNPCNASGNVTTCTLRGLQNGVAYFVQMTATNAAGTSQSVVSQTSVKPNGPPSGAVTVDVTPAPDFLTAQIRNLNMGGGLPDAKYEIRWDIAVDGATPCWLPVNYTVRGNANPNTCDRAHFPSSFSDSLPTCPVTYNSYGQTPTCTVVQLDQGVSLLMRATVQNQYTVDNPPSPSWTSTPVILTDVPKAPQDVSVSLGGATATIAWNKPVGDGGSPIIKYQVTSDPGGLQCEVTSPPLDGTRFQCQISGLTLGLTYTFSVVASNVSGSSVAAFSASQVVGAASPPTAVAAYPIDGGILVSWTQSASNGFPITLYTATARAGSKSAVCTTGGGGVTPTLSCVITVPNCPLNIATCPLSYQVSVTAQNVVGGVTRVSTPTSAVSSVNVYGVPGSPTNVTVIALEASLVVSWTPPETIGGGISMYVVTGIDQQPGAGSFYCTFIPGVSRGIANSCSLGNGAMQLGHSFNITVQAFGDVGGSSPSTVVSATTSKNAVMPSRVIVNAQSTKLIVQWVPFDAKGSNRATSYVLSTTPALNCSGAISPSGTECTGAVPGVKYQIGVAAKNSFGPASSPRLSAPTELSASLTQVETTPSASSWIASGGPSVLPTAGSVAFSGSTMFTVARYSAQIFATSSNLTTALTLSQDIGDPSAIAVAPDGTKLYVADAASGAILVMNSDGSNIRPLSITGLITPLSDPEALVLVGSTLYIADSGNGRIVAVPVTGGAARTVAPRAGFISPTSIAALTNGDLLVVDTGSRLLFQVSPGSGASSQFLVYDPDGLLNSVSPLEVAVSPDGGTVFLVGISTDGTSSILEMTASGGEVRLVSSESFAVGSVAVSPAGKLTYVGLRGVFSAQFRRTPIVPALTVQPSKNGVSVTWNSAATWDPWTYAVTVAPTASPANVKVCVPSATGCSLASGLTANTSYTLKMTVTGSQGTTPVTQSVLFTTLKV